MKLFFLLSCLLAATATAEPETVVYTDTPEGPLHLDLHLPETSKDKLHPVILWIHGGGWRQGSRRNWKLVEWLVAEDYAVVSIDYRLTEKAIFPAQIRDCEAALRWIGEHGRKHSLDPNRVVTAGLSAGAHLATLLAVSTPEDLPRVSGALHFYGPADFVRMMRYAQKPDDAMNTPASPIYGLLGGPLKENAELARLASPVEYLDERDPPLLIMVGTKDSQMTQRHCQRLAESAAEKMVRAELHVIDGAGHGGPEFSDKTRKTLILNFLQSLYP